MECTDVAGRLEFFIDEELLYQEMEAIRQHLQRCTCCEQKLQSERLFKFTLKDKILKQHIANATLENVRHIMDRAY